MRIQITHCDNNYNQLYKDYFTGTGKYKVIHIKIVENGKSNNKSHNIYIFATYIYYMNFVIYRTIQDNNNNNYNLHIAHWNKKKYKKICYKCREYNDSFNILYKKKYFYSDSCLHSASIVLRRSLFIDVSSISILIPYYVFLIITIRRGRCCMRYIKLVSHNI